MSEKTRPPRRSATLVLGGGLSVGAGILSLINGVQGILTNAELSILPPVSQSFVKVCGVLLLVLGALAVVGGVSAIRGGRLSLSLVGAGAGMLGGGLIGFYLGLGAIVLLLLSNQDL